VTHVSADKSVLLFGGGVEGRVAEPGCFLIVVVVAPFCKVVGELEAGGVRVGVLEVNDNELLVCVRRQEKRRRARGQETEDVTVLGLRSVR
jgi:hypothetical protein